MLSDQERWAEALHVHKVHGDTAAEHVGERVRALLDAGDMAGVERWLEIGARVAQLETGTVQ